MSFCMNCGRDLPLEAGFCPKCGTKVEIPVCPSCGKEIDLSDDFCLYCGVRLSQEPEPAPEPELEPVEENTIVCPACGREQAADRRVCWACGQSFTFDGAENLITPTSSESEPKKPVKAPEICPRCGKPTVAGYEHCVYCGTYWDTELSASGKPKQDVARAKAPQSKTVPSAPPKSATIPGGSWRDFSWTYRRAMVRWSMHMEIHAEMDDKQLRCTSTSKIFGQTDMAEEKMELKDISKMTLVSKASFMMWSAVSWMLSTFVALLSLPLFGVSLAVGGTELVLTALFLAGLCALAVWWVRFNLFHYRLVITGTVDGVEKKITLDALKANTLREFQEELTHRTGVQLPQQNESTGEFKAIFGAIAGICLAIALVVGVTSQTSRVAKSDLVGTWDAYYATFDGGATGLDRGDVRLDLTNKGTFNYSFFSDLYQGKWSYNGSTLTLDYDGGFEEKLLVSYISEREIYTRDNDNLTFSWRKR